MNPRSTYLVLFLSIHTVVLFGQTIPSDKIIPITELRNYLKEDIKSKLNTAETDELASYISGKNFLNHLLRLKKIRFQG